MRPRSINAKHASASTALMTAAMLAGTLIAFGAAEAQERLPYIQPSAATLMAAVQPIDPRQVGLDQASGRRPQHLEDATQHSATDNSQLTDITAGRVTGSLIVSANFRDPEAWDGFRQSVSGAATSSCFAPDALSHEEFAVQGLLRLPFLVRAASDGTCR
jgi:hypothetical protein